MVSLLTQKDNKAKQAVEEAMIKFKWGGDFSQIVHANETNQKWADSHSVYPCDSEVHWASS